MMKITPLRLRNQVRRPLQLRLGVEGFLAPSLCAGGLTLRGHLAESTLLGSRSHPYPLLLGALPYPPHTACSVLPHFPLPPVLPF